MSNQFCQKIVATIKGDEDSKNDEEEDGKNDALVECVAKVWLRLPRSEKLGYSITTMVPSIEQPLKLELK